jgi:hypothetical protein
METITTLSQLTRNLKKLEEYLAHGSDREKQEARHLIQLGTCFIAHSDGKRLCFAPSRFTGYVNNTLDLHSSNSTRHGGETNSAISEILGIGKPTENAELEQQYQQYCHSVGVVPKPKGSFGVARKYWLLS